MSRVKVSGVTQPVQAGSAFFGEVDAGRDEGRPLASTSDILSDCEVSEGSTERRRGGGRGAVSVAGPGMVMGTLPVMATALVSVLGLPSAMVSASTRGIPEIPLSVRVMESSRGDVGIGDSCGCSCFRGQYAGKA